jgi:hypothetical protein
MSNVELGVLFVESGDVISGTVLDGQFVSATDQGLWRRSSIRAARWSPPMSSILEESG